MPLACAKSQISPRFPLIKLALLLLIALLSGCVSSPLVVEPALLVSSPSPQTSHSLTVAAAADLQFAFSEIASLFEAQYGVKVKQLADCWICHR